MIGFTPEDLVEVDDLMRRAFESLSDPRDALSGTTAAPTASTNRSRNAIALAVIDAGTLELPGLTDARRRGNV